MYKYIMLLMLFVCSSCLHKTDDITLTTNPLDVEFTGEFYKVTRMECATTADGIRRADIDILFDAEVMKILEENEDGDQIGNIYDRIDGGDNAKVFYNSIPDGNLSKMTIIAEEPGPLKTVLEISIRSKRYLYPEIIWYTRGLVVECP